MAYRIENETEMQPRWFAETETVGIIVGATGLQALVDRVVSRLNYFGKAKAQGMLNGAAR